MNIKELKSLINNLPDNAEIYFGERQTVYDYGLINSAKIRDIDFENENGEMIKKTALLLDER